MRRIYLAHQLSAPTRDGIEENRRSAAKWGVWLSKTFGVAVSADWIWMTGELVSGGMTIETQHGREHGVCAYDLTGLPMDKAFIEAALAEQGCCPRCLLSSAQCLSWRPVQLKCCPDCTHGRTDV